MIHAVQSVLLRLWDAIHAYRHAVSSAMWMVLIRPATWLCCAAGGACYRVLASVGRAVWRWFASGLQILRRGIRMVARQGTSTQRSDYVRVAGSGMSTAMRLAAAAGRLLAASSSKISSTDRPDTSRGHVVPRSQIARVTGASVSLTN